jgi:hypothetical protein
MKVLVMGGAGKVGTALVNALKNAHEVQIVEVNSKPEVQKFDVLHVAIPWQGDFVSKVNAVVKEFKVGLVINHSTVPRGLRRPLDPMPYILRSLGNMTTSTMRFTGSPSGLGLRPKKSDVWLSLIWQCPG